jgi:hypothetical protein
VLERRKMRVMALRVVGLGAADPGPYLELLGPGESEAMKAAMLTMSGCGLTVRGLWRRFGLRDPRLEAPYEPASVMSTIQSMANEAGAWTAGLGTIEVGDVLYVSEPDHVGTVVDISGSPEAGYSLTTVDGGSTDAAGRQAIVTWERAIDPSGLLTAGPLAGSGRAVVGSVSLPALARTFGGAGVGLPAVAALGALALVGGAVARRVARRRA